MKVWDLREKGPVLALEPVDAKDEDIPDCWDVCFGNSYNADERTIVAGYDNGDIKIFDLNKNELLWDTTLSNGVCGVEFDRKDIIMNKLVATTLEGKFHVFDMRTQVNLYYAFITMHSMSKKDFLHFKKKLKNQRFGELGISLKIVTFSPFKEEMATLVYLNMIILPKEWLRILKIVRLVLLAVSICSMKKNLALSLFLPWIGIKKSLG